MEASGTCSHCGTQGDGFKRCSRCKNASYCSADCQKAAWKVHKTTCKKVEDLWDLLKAAHDARDWRQILKWEGRMGDLMKNQQDAFCDRVLGLFASGYFFAFSETSRSDHAMQVVETKELRVQLLGKMERFRDQGAVICQIAQFVEQCCYGEAAFAGFDKATLSSEVRRHVEVLFTPGKAAKYYQRARDVGAAHGFFSVECDACMGLGKVRPF